MYLIFTRTLNLLEFTSFLFFSVLVIIFGCTYTAKVSQLSLNNQSSSALLSKTFTNQLHNVSILSSPMKSFKNSSVLFIHRLNYKKTPTIRLPIHNTTLSAVRKNILPWKTIQVKPKDNFTILFKREKIHTNDYREILQLKKTNQILKQIHPGQMIKIMIDDQHHIQKLIYNIDATRSLEINRVNGRLIENVTSRKSIKKLNTASGIIKTSLSETAQDINLSFYWLKNLTEIFAWKIDFSRQIQPGDKFKIIYEEDFIDNRPLHHGKILGAEFTNRSTVYQAIRYEDKHGNAGYYTPTGRSLQTAFIRTPLKYTRISSPFNTKRVHPLLHIVKPHEGVDLAAPLGTPIKASGDGRIVFRGRKGGYGKVIIIKHNNKYTTLYAHLSQFKKGLYVNSYVKRGNTIGYVGQTGFATGPHLHYEFHVNGIPHNPMAVRLPTARSVPQKEKKEFLQYANQIVDKLNKVKIV